MARSMQDCFDAAVSYSSLNNASLYDSDMALIHMSFFQQRVYVMASLFNPDYFGLEGSSATRSSYDDPFDFTNLGGLGGAMISKVEVASVTGAPSVSVGDEINLISIRDPWVHESPRAYLRNKKLYGYDDELGAADAAMADAVKIFYTHLPPVSTDLNDTLALDDLWAHLVIVPMAAVLCLHDLRPEDFDRLMAEHQNNTEMFLQFISGHRFSQAHSLGSAPIETPSALLRGGS